MRTTRLIPAPIQFSTHNPENIIVIENHREGVTMRAAYDNFSMRRKAFLVRQLAAEGYIADRYEACTEDTWPRSLDWMIDRSLLVMGPQARRRSRRAMQRLILGACALWIAEMTLLVFLNAR